MLRCGAGGRGRTGKVDLIGRAKFAAVVRRFDGLWVEGDRFNSAIRVLQDYAIMPKLLQVMGVLINLRLSCAAQFVNSGVKMYH